MPGHRGDHANDEHRFERDSDELDDVRDRAELRDRFEMLLQELRVALPGVQVLFAFLLTAPFSDRFDRLDLWGRRAYAVALAASMLATVLLLGPTLLHRLGDRTARSARLTWSIRLFLSGLTALAVALTTAMWAVMRLVFDTFTAWAITAPLVVVMAFVWGVAPASLRATSRHDGTVLPSASTAEDV